jgi:hypothetical protein
MVECEMNSFRDTFNRKSIVLEDDQWYPKLNVGNDNLWLNDFSRDERTHLFLSSSTVTSLLRNICVAQLNTQTFLLIRLVC